MTAAYMTCSLVRVNHLLLSQIYSGPSGVYPVVLFLASDEWANQIYRAKHEEGVLHETAHILGRFTGLSLMCNVCACKPHGILPVSGVTVR